MTMTRQEQLDAVVRANPKWPDKPRYDRAFWRKDDQCVDFLDSRVYGKDYRAFGQLIAYGFTRAEVETRKAELQNKPSWDDAPCNAGVLVFDPKIESWLFGAFVDAKLSIKDPVWIGVGRGVWLFSTAQKGEVIGDWRDTLEKRPEPSTIDPRNGECIGDAKWNGEGLPTVGSRCLMKCMRTGKERTVTIEAVKKMNDNPSYTFWVMAEIDGLPKFEFMTVWDMDVEFRPIKSDRDQWKDAALHVEAELEDNYQPYELIEALYDAFKSGRLKLPEVE